MGRVEGSLWQSLADLSAAQSRPCLHSKGPAQLGWTLNFQTIERRKEKRRRKFKIRLLRVGAGGQDDHEWVRGNFLPSHFHCVS